MYSVILDVVISCYWKNKFDLIWCSTQINTRRSLSISTLPLSHFQLELVFRSLVLLNFWGLRAHHWLSPWTKQENPVSQTLCTFCSMGDDSWRSLGIDVPAQPNTISYNIGAYNIHIAPRTNNSSACMQFAHNWLEKPFSESKEKNNVSDKSNMTTTAISGNFLQLGLFTMFCCIYFAHVVKVCKRVELTRTEIMSEVANWQRTE